MPWTYSQSTHELRHNGRLVSTNGYSGRGPFKNNPDAEAIRNQGPSRADATEWANPTRTTTWGR